MNAPAEEGPRPVYAFWCRFPSQGNFGDALTPWLIQRLTGRAPIFARPEAAVPKYLSSGSIVEYANEHCIVWGSGIQSRNDWISPKAKLLAVRGPLTRARALECGGTCPEVHGDPALLLPRLHRPVAAPRGGVGIVPHFSDKPSVFAARRPTDELRFIDIQAGIEQVIDQIAACELIASSSLHGLIVSHAYGVPAIWIKFRDLPSGDGSKFLDYLLSVGHEPAPPLCFREDSIDADRLGRSRILAPPEVDLEPLWQACPWRPST